MQTTVLLQDTRSSKRLQASFSVFFSGFNCAVLCSHGLNAERQQKHGNVQAIYCSVEKKTIKTRNQKIQHIPYTLKTVGAMKF